MRARFIVVTGGIGTFDAPAFAAARSRTGAGLDFVPEPEEYWDWDVAIVGGDSAFDRALTLSRLLARSRCAPARRVPRAEGRSGRCSPARAGGHDVEVVAARERAAGSRW